MKKTIKTIYKKVEGFKTALAVGTLTAIASAPASALTCPGTAGETACEIVAAVDFTDAKYGALLAAAGLALLGVTLLGLRLGVAWVQGRKRGV